MLLRWQQWNRHAKLWLWVITLIGVAAAMPLGFNRMEMEKTSKNVEYVFDYRDILEVAEVQANPRAFLKDKLAQLKESGVTTLAVYESSLRELMQSGRLTYYSARDAALMQGKFETDGQNYTYILWSDDKEEEMIGPVVREAFDRAETVYRDWSFGGRDGLVVEMPIGEALLKTMEFDPMTLQELHGLGFDIVPRFSDKIQPYSQEDMDRQLGLMKEYGVTRIIFDGDKVKGASDYYDLIGAADLLNKYDIGLIAIENLRKPQAGFNTLAYQTDYNVVRLYSLSAGDGMEMSPGAIADRFLLAAKDRNIRMFFLNGMVQSDADKGKYVHNLDKLSQALRGGNGAVAKLAEHGFAPGEPKPFDYKQPSWSKPVRAVVALGAIALIALVAGTFVPGVNIPVFLLGLVGSAGLYKLNSSMMEQALALGAAIAAPTLALVWAMNRITSRTVGGRRIVGGDSWSIARSKASIAEDEKAADGSGSGEKAGRRFNWVFASPSVGKRAGLAINWFIVTALISLIAVPLVFGLLNNITYNLVLEQFRGVSLLHLAPIALVAVYVLFYTGNGKLLNARKLMSQPITLTWVLLAVVIGAVGYYYLTRTGNTGSVSSIELVIRNFLEQTFGVRPRFKEFLLAHPLLLLGLFLSLRYRAAWLLIIIGSIGQLSMVDTFAHLHTPLYISAIRVLLGLGTGAIIGCILIVAWQIAEGVLKKWAPVLIRRFAK